MARTLDCSAFITLGCTLGSILQISGEPKNETLANPKTWMNSPPQIPIPCGDGHWDDLPKRLQTPGLASEDCEPWGFPTEKSVPGEVAAYAQAETHAVHRI